MWRIVDRSGPTLPNRRSLYGSRSGAGNGHLGGNGWGNGIDGYCGFEDGSGVGAGLEGNGGQGTGNGTGYLTGAGFGEFMPGFETAPGGEQGLE